MINWFDMPAEGLSNGGLFEVKELEVTENGTYEQSGEMYNKVTVNVEGGGGSWQTVFEGSVTTTKAPMGALSPIENLEILDANTIKVTFNGTEYTCEKNQNGSYGAEDTNPIDFSEYPFCITYKVGTMTLITQTAGTYTLKIEEQSGGGSSDFSTAEVTIVNNAPDSVSFNLALAMVMSEGGISATVGGVSSDRIGLEVVANAVLYNGGAAIELQSTDEYDFNIEVSGDIQGSGYSYFITGDCTITIS